MLRKVQLVGVKNRNWVLFRLSLYIWNFCRQFWKRTEEFQDAKLFRFLMKSLKQLFWVFFHQKLLFCRNWRLELKFEGVSYLRNPLNFCKSDFKFRKIKQKCLKKLNSGEKKKKKWHMEKLRKKLKIWLSLLFLKIQVAFLQVSSKVDKSSEAGAIFLQRKDHIAQSREHWSTYVFCCFMNFAATAISITWHLNWSLWICGSLEITSNHKRSNTFSIYFCERLFWFVAPNFWGF